MIDSTAEIRSSSFASNRVYQQPKQGSAGGQRIQGGGGALACRGAASRVSVASSLFDAHRADEFDRGTFERNARPKFAHLAARHGRVSLDAVLAHIESMELELESH